MPPSDYSNSGWQFESANVYQAGSANYLMLGKQLNAYLDSGSLPPKDAFQIDKKLDDGDPATGIIINVRGLGTNDGQCVDKVWTAAPPIVYNKSNTESRCLLLHYFQR